MRSPVESTTANFTDQFELIEPFPESIRGIESFHDLYKVQRLLGHKAGTMTQRYAHHSPESLRDGVNVLDMVTIQSLGQVLAAIVKLKIHYPIL